VTLTNLLKKSGFNCTPITDQSLQASKEDMCTAIVLSLPDFIKTFVLECDVSMRGVREVLMQYGKPLDFIGKQLS
jgi:hypothetical protein